MKIYKLLGYNIFVVKLLCDLTNMSVSLCDLNFFSDQCCHNSKIILIKILTMIVFWYFFSYGDKKCVRNR